MCIDVLTFLLGISKVIFTVICISCYCVIGLLICGGHDEDINIILVEAERYSPTEGALVYSPLVNKLCAVLVCLAALEIQSLNLLSQSLWERAIHSLPDCPNPEH